MDLSLLKNGFAGLAAAALLFISVDSVLLSTGKGGITMSASEVSPASMTVPAPFENISAYLASLEEGSLFGGPKKQVGSAILQQSILELIKDYRLKGVVMLGDPEAIVENARTRETLFVKAGDSLGEVTVKEINNEMIVFSYYDEEKEVRIQ